MSDLIRKSFPTETVSVDMDQRTVTHYITTPTLDADGEVILPRGADISRFSKTRTIFDVHEYGSKDVVGRCMDLKIADDGIIAVTRFSPRPPTHPEGVEWWPDTLLWLYSIGDIKGWSIGLDRYQTRHPTKKDLQQYGEGTRVVTTRWGLVEYSVAPLPCNEDALTLAAKGLVSGRLADVLKGGKRPAKSALPELKPIVVIPPAAKAKKTIVIVLGGDPAPAAPTKARDQLPLNVMIQRAIAKARGALYAD